MMWTMWRRQKLYRTGPDRTGSDRIVHFGLRILCDLQFGFWFSVFGFRQKFKRDFQIFSGFSSI